MLYNSDALDWVKSKHMKRVESVDEALLRSILKEYSNKNIYILQIQHNTSMIFNYLPFFPLASLILCFFVPLSFFVLLFCPFLFLSFCPFAIFLIYFYNFLKTFFMRCSNTLSQHLPLLYMFWGNFWSRIVFVFSAALTKKKCALSEASPTKPLCVAWWRIFYYWS